MNSPTIKFCADFFRVYLGVKTCEVFLCLVAIVKVRFIMLTSLFFFLLRHW